MWPAKVQLQPAADEGVTNCVVRQAADGVAGVAEQVADVMVVIDLAITIQIVQRRVVGDQQQGLALGLGTLADIGQPLHQVRLAVVGVGSPVAATAVMLEAAAVGTEDVHVDHADPQLPSGSTR